MLTHIHIKNFVIIDELAIELQPGFTVLTGETGAGKSILIDALQLALGERADTQVLRQGAERCEITLHFSLEFVPEAQQWLIEHELASEKECIIRRIISADGRSRSFINGSVCPLQLIRELSPQLINIHGQHEHQSLLKRDKQRDLLDHFAGHRKFIEAINKIYSQWRQAKTTLAQWRNQVDRQARMELLRYQVEELQKLQLQTNELVQLEQEYKQLNNAERLIQDCQRALAIINEDETNLTQLLNVTLQTLEQSKNLAAPLTTAYDLLQQARINIDEASNELQSYADHIEINEDRLQKIDQRLNQIHELARKHRLAANELITLQEKLEKELFELEKADELAQELEQKINLLEKEYHTVAQQLSKSRKDAAEKLIKLVSKNIQTLGMPGGKFAIQFETITDINPHGLERVEFVISANPGQALQPLNKVASGGELSRVGLAIQVITAQKENTPSLIFDEVDVGIGGGIAEIVGKLLRQLGTKAQVFCITHLPQVAAQGHHHFQVKKQTTKNITQTQILVLAKQERIQEIARMLGGIKITDQTLNHAQEMLELA